MDFSTINWLAVAVATVASFVLGGIWYGPLLGKHWQALEGISDEDIKDANMAMIFGPAIILTLVQATVLAAVLAPGADPVTGAVTGAALGAAFIATGMGVNYLFARRPRALWFIDGGFNVVQLGLMGLVIGAWP